MNAPEPLRMGADPASAKALCAFVHGRSQSPEAMVEAIIGQLGTEDVHYVLPRAAGNSWYDARAVDPLTQATRAQLGAALDQLSRDIETAVADGAPRERLVLAGFSQGACLSLEWAMRAGRWPDALAVLTGCRIGAAGDERPAEALPDLPVYASCGDADPWIPLEAFGEATLALGRAGARLRTDILPGRPHGIAAPEIVAVDALLAAVAAGRPAFGAA